MLILSCAENGSIQKILQEIKKKAIFFVDIATCCIYSCISNREINPITTPLNPVYPAPFFVSLSLF